MSDLNNNDLTQQFTKSVIDVAESLINDGVSTPKQDLAIPDVPASKQRTSGYNETLDWLNHKGDFKRDKEDAGKLIRQVFEAQLMNFLFENLDGWALTVVKYAENESYALDVALAKVWILSQLEHTVAAVTEWQAGIAYAQKETLTSLAKAGGTSQPNVRTKWKNLDTIQQKFLAMANTGMSQTLKIHDLDITMNWDDPTDTGDGGTDTAK